MNSVETLKTSGTELEVLRKENQSLKTDIESLKLKLATLHGEYMAENLALECLTSLKSHNSNQHPGSDSCQESFSNIAKLVMDFFKDINDKKEQISSLKKEVKQLRDREQLAQATISDLKSELQMVFKALEISNMNSINIEKAAETSAQNLVVSKTCCKKSEPPVQETESTEPVKILLPSFFTEPSFAGNGEINNSSPVVRSNQTSDAPDKDSNASESEQDCKRASPTNASHMWRRTVVNMHSSAGEKHNGIKISNTCSEPVISLQKKFEHICVPVERNVKWKLERDMPKMSNENSSNLQCPMNGHGSSSLVKSNCSESSASSRNPIMVLKELCERQLWPKALYMMVHEFGPPHMRTFFFKVKVNGVEYKSAAGRTKQEAKAKAAETCLQFLFGSDVLNRPL